MKNIDEIKLSNKAWDEWQTWTSRKEIAQQFFEFFLVLTALFLFVSMVTGTVLFGPLLCVKIFNLMVICWHVITTHSQLTNIILVFFLLVSSAVVAIFIFKMIQAGGSREN
jgi:uncharacterized BrkB/YihY/UPF0761 family membrane protein